MFPRRFEAGTDRPGIAWADEEIMVAAVADARREADIVIPYMHWGQEQSAQAHARQRALARRLIAAGADAVVGTHPHLRQDTEIIDGKPVIYSLGNFVFDGFDGDAANTASLLWMDLGPQGVRDWRLQTVKIDPQGRPRPETR
jgi:poly-gamma-glutamate capsule biosynthesis protein CapA/YwtB (metallophosphatase superfamily)